MMRTAQLRWLKIGRTIRATMIISDFWQAILYDPWDGPGTNQYIFYLRFEPVPGRTLLETKIMAEEWAKKLIHLDRSELVELVNRLKAFAKPVDEREVIKTGRAFHLGDGTIAWIEMVPQGSRLNNEILMRTYISMLGGAFAAQVS
jgi:hypothetical protein